MSNIKSTIDSICYEITNQIQTINSKVNNVNSVWDGNSNDAFNEAHKENAQHAREANRKLESIKSLAQSLDSSIAAADRDRAERRAREAAERAREAAARAKRK